MQLQGFKTRPYHPNAKIKAKLERMRVSRTTPIVDGIVARVLEWQGFTIEENSSSEYNVETLYEKLQKFSPLNRKVLDMSSSNWQRAMKATFKMFAKPRGRECLDAITDYQTLYNNLDLDKSSGATNGNGKRDDWWYAVDRELQVRKGIKKPNPCLPGARTQLGRKTRLVYEYPYEMTLMEERFAIPLIDEFKERNTTMAFAKSKFELGGMIVGIETAFGQTRGLDFSGFDGSVPAEIIEFSFDVVKTWFTKEQLLELGWKRVVDYFINTPIVMPNGVLYYGKSHGVPSGSFFTQLIDSIVNTCLQFWISLELGYSLDVYKFKVLGDDVIITIPREIPTTSISDLVSKIGMKINAEKTKDYAHFLGATWIHGIPYRSKQEMMQKMKYPESWRQYCSKESFDRWGLGVQLIMQFSYAYANAWELLPMSKHTRDMSRIDYLPMNFAQSYELPQWDRLLGQVGWLTSSGENSVDDMKTKLMTQLILA